MMGRGGALVWLLAVALALVAPAARAGSPERIAGAIAETVRAPDDVERDYPLYGVAANWVTQVFTAPDTRAEVFGYFRRGASLRAGVAVSGAGCEGSWHAVFGGGYVCAGRSVMLGAQPQALPGAAAPPRLYDPLPYDYVKSKNGDVALFTALPTPEQEAETGDVVAAARRSGLPPLLAAERFALLKKLMTPPPRPPKTVLTSTRSRTRTPVPAKPQPQQAAKIRMHPQLRAAALPEVVRGLLQPGFYVSLDDATPADDSGFLRTARGDFVRLPGADRVKGGSRRGNVLPAVLRGTLALVSQPNARVYSRNVMTGALTELGSFRPLEALELSDEVIARGRQRYRVALDGRIAAESALRFLPVVERPKIIPSQARWIVVSLERQTLVAYDGGRPVFATLVSTGKKDHETPTGVFRIQSKHVSTTMDGEAIGNDDAYSIEDVPWVMYFTGSVALHAAFWHERFGTTRSHGCVNLAPQDARWLFDWAGPELPLGFHSVLSTAERQGTFVVVAP